MSLFIRACAFLFLVGTLFLCASFLPYIRIHKQAGAAAVIEAVAESSPSIAQAASQNTTPPQTPPQEVQGSVASPAPAVSLPAVHGETLPEEIAPSEAGASAVQPASSPLPAPGGTTPAPATPLAVAVWMQGNDWNAAVASVEQNASKIGEVSPAWYQTDAAGAIKKRSGVPVDDHALLSFAHENHLLVRPLVMSVTGAGAGGTIVSLLQSKSMRDSQVATLTSLGQEKGYDGFDLDYESIPASAMGDLASFVEELASSLHAVHKTLAVSLETQPSDKVIPAWTRIGIAADSVRLMAYGKVSKTPAPLVDIAWMRERLGRALVAIPQEKLSLGIPLYCSKWNETTIGSGTWASLHATSSSSVVCQNAASVKEIIDAAKELGVSNIALWRLGGEDPAVWDEFSD